MVRNCWGQIHKKVTQNHIYLQEELHHQLHGYQYHNFRIFFQVVLEDSRLHLCYLWRSISKTVTHDIKLEYSSYTLSEPNQTSKWNLFAKAGHRFPSLTTSKKNLIFNATVGPESAPLYVNTQRKNSKSLLLVLEQNKSQEIAP